MIDEPSAEYQSAFADLEEAHKTCLRAFAKWFASEWKITREEWAKSYADPPPVGDWFDGHNAGVESVEIALDSFLGDFHP